MFAVFIRINAFLILEKNLQLFIIGFFEAFNPWIGLKRTVSEDGKNLLLRIKSDLKRKSERATIETNFNISEFFLSSLTVDVKEIAVSSD